jgi:hypothetical protein
VVGPITVRAGFMSNLNKHESLRSLTRAHRCGFAVLQWPRLPRTTINTLA